MPLHGRGREQHRRSRQVPSPFHSTAATSAGLGAWVAQQRHAWKTGRLQLERQQALAALGFCPDAFQDAWAARFAQLAAFHSQHGHCRVPPLPSGERRKQQQRQQAQESVGYPGLHPWLQQQLLQWRRGTLPDERRRQLEGLGVEFQAHQAGWERRYEELLQFRQVS